MIIVQHVGRNNECQIKPAMEVVSQEDHTDTTGKYQQMANPPIVAEELRQQGASASEVDAGA